LEYKELDWVQILAISTNYPDGNPEAIKDILKKDSNGVPSYCVKLVFSPKADDLLKEKKSKRRFHRNVNLAWEETVKKIPALFSNYKHFDFISNIEDKLNARSQDLCGKSVLELKGPSNEFGKKRDLCDKYIWDPKEYLITWLGDKPVPMDFRPIIGIMGKTKLVSKISPFILHHPNDEYNYEIVSRETNVHYLFILKVFYSQFLKELENESSWLSEKTLQREDIITITTNFSIENQTEIEQYADQVEKSIERIGFQMSLSKPWKETKSLKPRIKNKSFLYHALRSAIRSVEKEWYDVEIAKIMNDDLEESIEYWEFRSNFSFFIIQNERKSDRKEIKLLWDKEIPDPYSLIPKFISSVLHHIQTELEIIFQDRSSNWKDYILVESINI
jgi:hypothetical protein